jgi:hypothetical protein
MLVEIREIEMLCTKEIKEIEVSARQRPAARWVGVPVDLLP